MKNRKRFLVILLSSILCTLMAAFPVSAATPDAITPDGNLTLVDDFSGETTAGKQFVTIVTKNGNYFYLIIDRDDNGKETVHFLNQVDESDLLSLMDEEEIESLGLQEEPIVEIVPEEPEEIIIEEPETIEEAPLFSVNAVLFMGAVVIGLLIIAALKLIEMKKLDEKEKKDAVKSEEDDECYEFMDLEQEMNGEGLDEGPEDLY